MPERQRPRAGSADLDSAYASYRSRVLAQGADASPMSAADFERYSLGSNWLTDLRDIAKKLVQTCRLVVGIQDYDYYLDHMRSRHPEATPFTREEFYRYCLEARFPSAERVADRLDQVSNGAARFPSAERVGSRCPC